MKSLQLSRFDEARGRSVKPRRPGAALNAGEREAVLKYAFDQLGRDSSSTGDGAIIRCRTTVPRSRLPGTIMP